MESNIDNQSKLLLDTTVKSFIVQVFGVVLLSAILGQKTK